MKCATVRDGALLVVTAGLRPTLMSSAELLDMTDLVGSHCPLPSTKQSPYNYYISYTLGIQIIYLHTRSNMLHETSPHVSPLC